MRPVLFHLGPFPIYSFGVTVAAGVMLSLFLMSRSAKKSGFPPGDLAFDMTFVGVAAGFFTARLYYVLQEWALYRKNPLQFFAIWEGGLIFYGGVLGSLAGLWLFFKLKKILFFRGLDFIIPYVALTHAFGRIGCFLNGCCHGKICHYPWAVEVSGLTYKVHPTQLYEMVFNFFLFAFLYQRYSRRRFDGEISAFYFMFYSMARFAIEFWREDNPFWGSFTVNQWLSVLIFTGAFLFYLMKRRSSHDD